MTDKLGYEPTFDMVRSWDQAIVTQGRTFVVNLYIDKRYENKIFKSAISGAGAFMYDAISAAEYIDLENFDGNTLVGVEVLPNLQFLALRANSAQRVDPDTGATRQISLGKGCVARKSIVNFGDKVGWCGQNDIYMSDGLNIVSIADKSIRELYRALTTKSSIIATREEKDNAYRFFTGDTSARTEYILTKKGWIKRLIGATSVYPNDYSLESSGEVNFMYNGIIYEDDDAASDASFSIIGEWQSVDFDNELLGEAMTERDFIKLTSIWIDYTGVSTATSIRLAFSLYGDGSSVKTFTTDLSNGRNKLFHRLPILPSYRRFSLKIVLSAAGVTSIFGKTLLIHSVGALWMPIKVGIHN